MVVSMKNFIKRLFNLDRVEQLEFENARLKDCWEAENQKRKADVRALDLQLKTYREHLRKYDKTWKGLSKFDDSCVYYVVTQGGYYQIKGWKINKSVMSEVTRRAVKNGFVVSSESEAKRLQEALQRLAW